MAHNGRMPVRFYSFFRFAFPAIFSLVFAVIFLLQASPAHADPHAVFYTDRAQEQLFYNVLAALNQADYVEPGIPGSPYSRTNLVQNRSIAAQPDPTIGTPYASPNPIEQSTHTNLPSVVTRNITLEGNDLWTAYLSEEFALETDVRRSISELSRLYCQNSLGRAGCSNQPGPAQEQSEAFPADANAYAQQPNLSLVSALSSGTQAETDFQDVLTGNAPADALHPANGDQEANLPPELKFPRANSPELSALRTINKDNKDALSVIDNTTSSVVSAQYGSTIEPDVFSNIKFSDNGNKAEIADNKTFNEYVDTLMGINSLLTGSIQVADHAYQQGLAFQQDRDQTPSLGQYVLTKQNGGGVTGTVTVPSSAVADTLSASANLLPNEVIGEKIAGNQEATIPGQQPDLLSPKANGAVAGISTTDPSPTPTPQPSGQVAGITDFSQKIQNLYNTYYASPQPNPNNATTGLVPAYEETGNSQLLEALGIKIPNINPKETTCGFCTDLSGILGTGSSSSSTSSSIFSDLYCYFFPTIQSCVARKEPIPTVAP